MWQHSISVEINVVNYMINNRVLIYLKKVKIFNELGGLASAWLSIGKAVLPVVGSNECHLSAACLVLIVGDIKYSVLIWHVWAGLETKPLIHTTTISSTVRFPPRVDNSRLVSLWPREFHQYWRTQQALGLMPKR